MDPLPRELGTATGPSGPGTVSGLNFLTSRSRLSTACITGTPCGAQDPPTRARGAAPPGKGDRESRRGTPHGMSVLRECPAETWSMAVVGTAVADHKGRRAA